MNTLFSSSTFWIAYTLTNLAAVLLVTACYRRPVLARFSLALLFGWAGWFNIITVLETPWVYSDFADYVVFPVYRWFILGPFDKIAVPFILTIAAGQLFIAVAMPMTGRLFRAGCLAGFVFSLAILPLGLGSAFPAMLFLALGFYRLSEHPGDHLLWKRKTNQPDQKHLQTH